MKIAIWLLLAFFLYPYLIYPLILKLWPKRERRSSWPETWPKVTLLITAYNEENFLPAKIENSLAIDYPDLEIIIVSDGSTDKTNAILMECPHINHLLLPQREGKPTAIKAGLAKAKGEVICFSDVSALYNKNSLKALVAPLLQADVGATGGVLSLKKQISPIKGEMAYSDYETKLRKMETAISGTIVLPGTFYAVKKDDIVIPPQDIIADDFFITCSLLKKGLRLLLIDKAHAFEQASFNTEEEFQRKARIIAGGIQTIFHFPELLRSRWGFFLLSHKLLRWAAIFTGLLHYLLLFFNPIYPWLLLIESCFILLGLLGILTEKKGLNTPYPMALLRHFLVVNTAVIWGFFGLVSGRQTVIWKR